MDNMKFVFDNDGNKIFYQSAVNLMDDETPCKTRTMYRTSFL